MSDVRSFKVRVSYFEGNDPYTCVIIKSQPKWTEHWVRLTKEECEKTELPNRHKLVWVVVNCVWNNENLLCVSFYNSLWISWLRGTGLISAGLRIPCGSTIDHNQ